MSIASIHFAGQDKLSHTRINNRSNQDIDTLVTYMPNLWPPCGVAGRQGGPSRAVAMHSELDDGRHVLPSVIIGFTHFETTSHSHDSTIHIELIDALHTQCFAVQLRFEPPKKLLFGRSMRHRNTLLHFLRIMYATYTVYIPTLSGNPFLINQRGFYWLNSAFRQSELRSMGPAPEV